jgi:hypothetical protein
MLPRRAEDRPPPASFACLPLLVLALLGACSPSIGDSCNSSLDCSVTAERICDRASPGGYCTVPGCEAGRCPDEAVCVEFQPEPQRLAQTFCMRRCSGNSDCRGDYECLRGSDLPDLDTGEPVARSLDGDPDRRFCVYPDPFRP